ncbi:MAG: ABC transporter ATP-binding protein, partial [Umezawaea sp.]
MIEAMAAGAELLRLSWRQSPAKLTVSIVLKLAGAVTLPLSATAVGVLTDAVAAGRPARAMAAGAVAAFFVVGAITLGHFAHVLYFELGEINFLQKDRELIQMINGSDGLHHLERDDCADRMQVLRHDMRRLSYSSMEALLSTLGLLVGIVLTAVLLARLHPLLLLLPLAALLPLLTGRRAEDTLWRGRQRAARTTRRARHLF